MRSFVNGMLLGVLVGAMWNKISKIMEPEEVPEVASDSRRRIKAQARNMMQKVGSGVSEMWKK